MYISTSSALCVPYRGKQLRNLQLYLDEKVALLSESNDALDLPSLPMQATSNLELKKTRMSWSFAFPLHVYLFLCNEIISFYFFLLI